MPHTDGPLYKQHFGIYIKSWELISDEDLPKNPKLQNKLLDQSLLQIEYLRWIFPETRNGDEMGGSN